MLQEPGREQKKQERKKQQVCLNANNKYNKNSIAFCGLFLNFRANPDSRFTTVPTFNMLYQNEIKTGSLGYGYKTQVTGVEYKKPEGKMKEISTTDFANDNSGSKSAVDRLNPEIL